jgi:MFS family permease
MSAPLPPKDVNESTRLLNDENGSQPHGQGLPPQTDQNEWECAIGDGNLPILSESTTLQLLKIMSGVYLGAFLAALDSTLVATIAAPISSSLKSMSLLSWLASAYFIANAVSQPLSGKLTDIYGRKAGLILCNASFAIGNLMCALAGTAWVLILGRVVAGIGGGGLVTIATFVGSDLVPLRKRGVWQGVANICFGLGSGVGGVFGGWMSDAFSWRWAFVAQIPLTFLAGLLVSLMVNIPVEHDDRNQRKFQRIDVLGAVSLIASLVLMLVGLNFGGDLVPWTHPLVLTTLPLSVVVFVAFIYVETQAEEPIIPVKLLLQRTVWSACLTNWFITMARFGLLFYGPIYLQVQGYSATQAGLRFVPEAVGIAVMSIGSGIVMRWTGRYYLLNTFVEAIFVCSLGLTSTFTLDTSSWLPFLYFFLAGIGYSGMLTVTLVALIAAVDQKYQAVITSASYAFRSTGSTIGITVASVVFQNILTPQLWRRLGHEKSGSHMIKQVRNNLGAIKELPPLLREGAREAYMDALRGIFLTLLATAVLGAVVSLFMREHTLHSKLSRRRSSASERP